MKKLLPLIVIIILIVSGGAFYGGMQYTKSKGSGDRRARFQEFGGAGNAIRGGVGARERGGMTRGEIIAHDDKSITVKVGNTGSRIIFLSDTTEITKQTKGSRDDLAVGTTVVVQGDENPDKSVTAKTIQISPYNQ